MSKRYVIQVNNYPYGVEFRHALITANCDSRTDQIWLLLLSTINLITPCKLSYS